MVVMFVVMLICHCLSALEEVSIVAGWYACLIVGMTLYIISCTFTWPLAFIKCTLMVVSLLAGSCSGSVFAWASTLVERLPQYILPGVYSHGNSAQYLTVVVCYVV